MAYCTFYIDLENVIKMREMNKEGAAMYHTKIRPSDLVKIMA